jgi:shikimate dehydrogenase
MGLDVIYHSFSVPIDAETYANLLRAPFVRGGAVTGHGLKTSIVPYLDHIDPFAQKGGSVNTVIHNNGKLTGYDTDTHGLTVALKNRLRHMKLQIKTAVVYGNGGVSGVAVRVLQSLGMKVTLTGRNEKRIATKMKQLDIFHFDGPYDLFVNATPASDEKLEKAACLCKALAGTRVVFDHNMPERDGRRNYLREYCEKYDIPFIPGNDMYTPQMIQQWSLFLESVTGSKVSERHIRKYWNIT